MRVNVTGVFNCVCAVAPVMREANWGASSTSRRIQFRWASNYLHYVASKAAVIGMTNSLARELGPHGVTVNCIRPGGVATEVDRTVNPTTERRQRSWLCSACSDAWCLPTSLVSPCS